MYSNLLGLNGIPSTVSFQSTKSSNMYLRHSNYVIKLNNVIAEELFSKDASFLVHENSYYPGFTSIQSYNYQDRFIRLNNNELRIDVITTDQSKKDASFKITSM